MLSAAIRQYALILISTALLAVGPAACDSSSTPNDSPNADASERAPSGDSSGVETARPVETASPPADEDRTRIVPMTIHDAVDVSAIEIVRQRLEGGESVNATDENGSSPLHIAAKRGHLEIATLLLEADADPNWSNDGGATPLHWATRGNHLPVVRLLVENGASLTARDSRQMSALDYAIANYETNEAYAEVVEYLQQASGQM